MKREAVSLSLSVGIYWPMFGIHHLADGTTYRCFGCKACRDLGHSAEVYDWERHGL